MTAAPRIVAFTCPCCGTREALVADDGRWLACAHGPDAACCECDGRILISPRPGDLCSHLTVLAALPAERDAGEGR